METPEDYIGQVIDIYSENVAAIIHPDGTEEPAHGKYTIDGRYKVVDYDEGNNEFALITEADAQRGEEGLDFTPYVYYVEADSVGGYPFDYEEHYGPEHDQISNLYEQYGMPAAEHPLGPHTGNQEYDIEAYANIPEEFNQKLIELIGHMRAAGVPQDTIMREIRDLIDIYVNSNPNNIQTNNQVNNMDDNFEAGRAGIPDEHISAAFTPEELDSKLSDWNDGYSDEELDAIDNPAQPSAAEKVAEYLDRHNEEGSELWTHLWEGSRALSEGNIEDGSAHLRILVEIFQNLLAQLDEGRTAKAAPTQRVASKVDGFTVKSDTELGEIHIELDNGDYISAKDIDLFGPPSKIVDYGFTTDLPSQPFVSQPGVERELPTSIDVGSVEYYTVESDGNPAALYGRFSQEELERFAKYVDVESIYQQQIPEEIKAEILGAIESSDEINQQLDEWAYENPPEPDWDSMRGGADW